MRCVTALLVKLIRPIAELKSLKSLKWERKNLEKTIRVVSVHLWQMILLLPAPTSMSSNSFKQGYMGQHPAECWRAEGESRYLPNAQHLQGHAFQLHLPLLQLVLQQHEFFEDLQVPICASSFLLSKNLYEHLEVRPPPFSCNVQRNWKS